MAGGSQHRSISGRAEIVSFASRSLAGRPERSRGSPVLNCTVASRDSSTPLRFARNDQLCGRAEAVLLVKCGQYFGTLESICSDHASIPPSRLYTLVKPRC